jgi:hypothetical protein
MKKMSAGGHTVLPIFYDVPPSHVRYKTGSFTSSFNKHKEKFKTQTDKINQWRDALIDATKLAGMELNDRSYMNMASSTSFYPGMMFQVVLPFKPQGTVSILISFQWLVIRSMP